MNAGCRDGFPHDASDGLMSTLMPHACVDHFVPPLAGRQFHGLRGGGLGVVDDADQQVPVSQRLLAGAGARDLPVYAGQGGGEVVAAGARALTGNQDIRAANPLRPVTDAIRGGMSEGDKLASQDTFKGDITSPSTIELPKTAGGWAHAIASGFGSLSSMILPGAMAATGARGMIMAGAATGALTTGGAAADEVRQNVQKAMEGQTPDQLAESVPAYRQARLQGYGLEDIGVPTHRTVDTNEYLQTIYPNIFAAGDVAGPYQFTHTAAHQAWYAAVNALFGDFKKFKADYSVIPWATFIDPEVARVGLNEQDAKEQGIAYEVTKYGIDDLDRAIADSEAHGFVKVLTVPGKDKILGVTIVGTHAGDLLAEYVLAMKHGLGLNKILGTIHTYPTLAEANKYAAGEWKRAHQPHKLLEWVRKFHDWKRG